MGRKRGSWLAAILFAVMAFAFAGVAHAQMGPGMMGSYGYGYGGGYHSLTPEKQAVAQKLYSAFYSQTRTLRQQLITKQYELNAMIYGAKADDKKIQELSKEISELRSKLFDAQVTLQRQLAKEDIPLMGGISGGGMMGPGYGFGHGMGMF
ncbi:periplasmic heavy metal sensor [Fundidesulfovibrio butyratiphilus]